MRFGEESCYRSQQQYKTYRMVATNLQKAETERDSIKCVIALIETQVATAVDQVDVEDLLTQATEARTELVDIHKRILACVPADMDPHQKDYQDLLLQVSKVVKDLSRMKMKLAVTSGGSSSSSSGSTQVKLPPLLSLPQFNGTLSDWTSFRDMYVASVHNNTDLKGGQKLTYLKSCLVGEARKILKSVPPTDAGYLGAWKLLTDRYESEREITFSILKKFLGLPNVKPDSADGIRSLVYGAKECWGDLDNIKVPVQHWDVILVYHVMQKLDSASRQAWELSLADTSNPKLDDLFAFLMMRARGLDAGNVSSKTKSDDSGKRVTFAHHTETAKKCKFCKADHDHHKCSKFQSMTVGERREAARKHRLCFNCLGMGHPASECPTERACSKCHKTHHSLLHGTKSEPGRDREGSSVALGYHAAGEEVMTNSILATALLKITDRTGQLQTCRALLDGGSTSSFISERCVQRLGLRREKNSVDVIGLGSTAVGAARGAVSISFYSHFDEKKTTAHTVTALVLRKVTGKLPIFKPNTRRWNHLASLQLADPCYQEPDDVDVLLGADIFFDLLLDGRRRGAPGTPMGLRSTLGWLVAGSLGQQNVSHVKTHFADTDLDKTLQQFWELESVPHPEPRLMTKEEKMCEEHFKTTTTRNSDGRYVVKFPFKEGGVDLGPSRDAAVRRLIQLERRLDRNPTHGTEYRKFMSEYESLGHMETVSRPEPGGPIQHYYIPHHLVVKESSTTTKFRVVFNASIKTATGFSLNDGLLIGPTLQDGLVSILMRFRTHAVAYTADLVKMYRQVLMSPDDSNYQRIVWRDTPQDPIQDYRLMTVTYGTASGSHLATKVLQTLAEDEKDELPLAAQVAARDFYVDDCMSGAPDVETALKTQDQLRELMRRGGFDIRKWSSNRP